jgi:hypothetical protein
MLNDRHNFFLVAEAMLFVFYATLDVRTQVWALVAIAALGLVLTAMWVLIAIRQERDLKISVKRLNRYCEEYREFEEIVNDEGRFRSSGPWILGRCVPTIIAVAWGVLIVEVFTRSV